MLQYFARLHPEVAFTLKLNDPQVPSNNGIYTIAGGNCIHTDQISGPIDSETDIPVLTQALLGYHPDILPASFKPIIPGSKALYELNVGLDLLCNRKFERDCQ